MWKWSHLCLCCVSVNNNTANVFISTVTFSVQVSGMDNFTKIQGTKIMLMLDSSLTECFSKPDTHWYGMTKIWLGGLYRVQWVPEDWWISNPRARSQAALSTRHIFLFLLWFSNFCLSLRKNNFLKIKVIFIQLSFISWTCVHVPPVSFSTHQN